MFGLRACSAVAARSSVLRATQRARPFSGLPSQSVSETRTVTLLPGDGIGPEIVSSVVGVFNAAGVPVEWEKYEMQTLLQDPDNPRPFELLPHEVISSIARNGVCLKGPFYTPLGAKTSESRNSLLRRSLDTFANVVPVSTLPGLKTRHRGVDINFIVIRENTEAEYSGLEQQLAPGVVQSLKVVTEKGSTRIARFAFEYAVRGGRKKVTAIHKANIQKQTDGLFLKSCRAVALEYPQIQYDEMIVDNTCMQLIMNPSQFDVMVTPNLYGNIVANIGSGLVGGPGVTPGANLGHDKAVFEVGARHVGLDIRGQNVADPTALLLSSVMMLRHLNLPVHADRIENAVLSVIERGKVRCISAGGTATTKQFTAAIINSLTE